MWAGEGIAFSPDGQYLYVGNFVEGDIDILRRDGDTLAKKGNVTGLSYYATELTEERLEILREMVPSASVIGVLSNPAVAYLPFDEDTKRAARSFNVRLSFHAVSSPADISAAFGKSRSKPDSTSECLRPEGSMLRGSGVIAAEVEGIIDLIVG